MKSNHLTIHYMLIHTKKVHENLKALIARSQRLCSYSAFQSFNLRESYEGYSKSASCAGH